MRAMRKAAMQRGVVAVLDVGHVEDLRAWSCASTEPPGGGVRRGGAARGADRVPHHRRRHHPLARDALRRDLRAAETERAIRTAVQAAQKMAGVRVDHVIAALAGGRPRSYGLAGAVERARRGGQRARRRAGTGGVRPAPYRRGARSAARPAGQLRDRPPHRAQRSARPDRPAARLRHAPADDRRRRDPQPAALHQALRPRAGGAGVVGLRLGLSQRWSRTSRSWARPASTWAAARPRCRSSCEST